MNTKFEINKIYSVQTDNYYFGKTCGEFKEYIYANYKCIKRTNKTVTFEEQDCMHNIIKMNIRFDENNNEVVFIKGRNKFMYSK